MSHRNDANVISRSGFVVQPNGRPNLVVPEGDRLASEGVLGSCRRLLVILDEQAGFGRLFTRVSPIACLSWTSTRLVDGVAAADLVLADARGLSEAELPGALCALDRIVGSSRRPLAIAFAREQLDLVAEVFLGRATLLCDPDSFDLASALSLASTMDEGSADLNERGEDAERLRRLSGEVARLAGLLATELAIGDGSQAGAGFVTGPRRAVTNGHAAGPAPITADEIRAVVRARRLRDDVFGEGLFEDPAWDMLLDLYAAELEGRRVSVSSLCIAAAVAPTTALRWINRMTELGLFDRSPDEHDRRRAFMALTDAGREAMTGYLAAAKRAGLPIA